MILVDLFNLQQKNNLEKCDDPDPTRCEDTCATMLRGQKNGSYENIFKGCWFNDVSCSVMKKKLVR